MATISTLAPYAAERQLCICRNPECRTPYGYCHCGCGHVAPIATRNAYRDFNIKGEPKRFINGHASIKHPEDIDEPVIYKDGVPHRRISLTRGQYALVSPHRYPELNKFKWQAFWNPTANSFYAVRHSKRGSIYMHRFILGLPFGDPRTGDHIVAGDTLNNVDSNLRIATQSEQQHNKRKSRNNTSGFTGVYQMRSGRWRAIFNIRRKQVICGMYDSPQEAHSAREAMRRKYLPSLIASEA